MDHTRRTLLHGILGILAGCALALPCVAPAEEPEVDADVEASVRLERRDAGEALDAASTHPLRVEINGRIERPLAAVRDALLDIEGFEHWFPALVEWRVLERASDSALVHGVQAIPWPLHDRDYVVLYRWRDGTNPAFTLEAVAQVDAAPAPARGRVRVEALRTLWTLRDAGARTEVQYLYEGDPGMPIPDWVTRRNWRRHAAKVIEALAREVDRRVQGGTTAGDTAD